MFEISNLVIINKVDTLSLFDFSIEKAKEKIATRNPKAKVFCVSAKTGEGTQEEANYLLSLIR